MNLFVAAGRPAEAARRGHVRRSLAGDPRGSVFRWVSPGSTTTASPTRSSCCAATGCRSCRSRSASVGRRRRAAQRAGSEIWLTITSPTGAAADALGPDALIVQGVEAGGHRGPTSMRTTHADLSLLAALQLDERRSDGRSSPPAGSHRRRDRRRPAGRLRSPARHRLPPLPRGRNLQRPSRRTDHRHANGSHQGIHRTPRPRDPQPLPRGPRRRRTPRVPGGPPPRPRRYAPRPTSTTARSSTSGPARPINS